MKIENRRTPPDAPNPGDRYFDVIREKILTYDGNSWIENNLIIGPNSEPSAISIFSKDTLEVLRINQDGSVLWRRPGSDKLTPVEMDEDLGLAFSLCVETFSGLSGSTLMRKIREEAVNEYLNKKA